MKTSTKMLVAAAILLGGTSATLAQSVNDPTLYGGGSVGSNRNLNSALQNSRPYPGPPSHLQTIAWGSSVNDPLLYGGGSIGSNRNLNSALQNSRKYPW
jgi:hypothetical protein